MPLEHRIEPGSGCRAESRPGRRRSRRARFAIAGGVILSLALGGCGNDDKGASASASSTSSTAAALATGATAATTATSAPPTAGEASVTTVPPAAAPVTAMAVGSTAVAIADFAFMPTPVVVRPGGTVTWTNRDDAVHSISDTSPLRTAESRPMSKEDQFSITYTKAGTHPYVCGIHNYMQGSVEVQN